MGYLSALFLLKLLEIDRKDAKVFATSRYMRLVDTHTRIKTILLIHFLVMWSSSSFTHSHQPTPILFVYAVCLELVSGSNLSLERS